MLNLDWENIYVMIVDDNAFMCRLLGDTLRTLGIVNCKAEPDCGSAIQRLKMSKTDPVGAGLGEVDLIISDYLMPGVDGNLFLRWVRSGEGAPDRFVPFIMVSGAADKVVVEAARDAGVTEFLAKPFSASSLANRVLATVNASRAFILTRGYFGPDRRRLHAATPVERRMTRTSEIQVVKPDSAVRTLREDVRAIHFQPENRLRHKLGPKAMGRPVEFDPQVIRAAEARIQQLVGDYSIWVKKYLESMAGSLAALRFGESATASNRKHISNINRIAHELRGQGGTFDYPLITEFGKSLYQATSDSGMIMDRDRQKLFEAHIDAIRTVFKNRIKGHGGQVGEALLQEIEAAAKRYG